MKVGVGTGKNRAMVFNTFQLSSEGFGYIDNPHEICLPQLPETAEPSTQQASCVSNCLKAVFQKVKELNPSFTVGETLLGILADWSDTWERGCGRSHERLSGLYSLKNIESNSHSITIL